MDEATRLQKNRERLARWRARKRQGGHRAVILWLPEAQALYLEDLAIKRHMSPSALVEQALSQVYPGSTDATVTATDTLLQTATDTHTTIQQVLAVLEQATRDVTAIRQGQLPTHHATATATDTVTDTATVTQAFDPTTYHLGKLCPQAHAYANTGQTLYNAKGDCRQCATERTRRYREKKKAAQPA